MYHYRRRVVTKLTKPVTLNLGAVRREVSLNSAEFAPAVQSLSPFSALLFLLVFVFVFVFVHSLENETKDTSNTKSRRFWY